MNQIGCRELKRGGLYYIQNSLPFGDSWIFLYDGTDSFPDFKLNYVVDFFKIKGIGVRDTGIEGRDRLEMNPLLTSYEDAVFYEIRDQNHKLAKKFYRVVGLIKMVKSPKFRCKKYLKVLDGRFNHVLKFKNEGRWYLYLYNDWNVLNQLQRVQNNEKCFSCNELVSMECKLISEYDSEHYFCAVCFVEYKESWLLDGFESEWGTC